MASLCPSCHFQNPQGMRFCGNCGTRLPEAAATNDAQLPQIDPAQFGIMSGANLLDRFRQAGLESKDQRRDVTVLFVDLSGYTALSERLPDEELYGMVQRFIDVLVRAVNKYEGMVDKLTGDGLMALFGAPISHENDAERAVRAAMDMLEDVNRLSNELNVSGCELQIHVGLNAGKVIVGGVGGDGMMNYTAIGDSVNLARRLEEAAAPGEVLVSASVSRQVQHLFALEAIPPLSLKNVSLPVAAFRLLSERPSPTPQRGIDGFHAPMIGRQAEFDQVQAAVERLANLRVGGVLLLVGEGGMGKSRLIREVKEHLDGARVQVFEGRSLTYRKSIAYWIFQDVLRNVLGVGNGTAETQLRGRLERRLLALFGEAGREKQIYLEYLFGLAPSDFVTAERVQYLDSGQLRQLIFLAVRDVLVELARKQPLLLILEDLHWADDASLELLRFLLDSTYSDPLLIISVSRPLEGGAVQALHERAVHRLGDRFLYLDLNPLKPEQSGQLLQSLLAVADLPEDLRARIIERSAGLPLYLEEILRMLIDDRIITCCEGVWRVSSGASLENLGVPQSLQNLILTRFDRLLPLQRTVLQSASVIGYQFQHSVLKKVLHQNQVEITDELLKTNLMQLVEKDFLLPLEPGVPLGGSHALDPVEEDCLYQFKHVLVSDAVYSTLLQRDRRRLHTQVGQALEQVFKGRLDGQTEELASHFLRSTLPDRALYYLVMAGQKAARSFANNQARQWFQQAVEVMESVHPSPDQVVDVHAGLGDALLTGGEYVSARKNFQSAMKALDARGQTGTLSLPGNLQNPMGEWNVSRICQINRLFRKVSATYASQGDFDRAMDYLHSAIMMLPADAQVFDTERANTLNDTGWIYFRRGELQEAEEFLQNGLRLAELSGQLDVIASILNRLAGIFFQRDAIEPATRYLMRSLRLREEIGDVVGVARTYNNLGLLAWKSGNLQAALEYFRRSDRLQQDFGDVEGLIMTHTNMGLIDMDCGRLVDARYLFAEALQSAQQIGHHFLISMANLHLALLHVYAEDWQTARLYGECAQQGFAELGVTEHALDLMVSLGWAYLGLGDRENLLRCQEQMRDLLAHEVKESASDGQGRAYRLLARIAEQDSDLNGAREKLQRSIAVFQRSGSQMECARTQVDLARLYARTGKFDESEALMGEARSVFERMGASQDLQKLMG